MDEIYLQCAIDLASANVTRGDGGPFGAVIVCDGDIIAEGWNRVIVANDPTAHAEIVAIRAACSRKGHFHLPGCTLYTSSEPCPMCLAAAYWARVERIVFANSREQAAAIGFCDENLYGELQLPLQQRHIATCHLPLPDADLPLRRWLANPGHRCY